MIRLERGVLPRRKEAVMKRSTKTTQGTWELERDATLRLAAGREGILLRAERGTVLVTREGDAEDHVVVPGEPLLVTGKGLVVAWALEPSRLNVALRGAEPAGRAVAARLAA